jgi:hypothetical protein
MILFILCITITEAVEYHVTTINKCVGNANIKIQTAYNDSYYIIGCSVSDAYWVCQCSNPTDIKIFLNEDTKNKFDFTIFYYVDDISNMSDIGKASAERKNIISGVTFEQKKEDDTAPLNGKLVMGIISVVVLIGLVGMFFVGKYIYKKIMSD